METLKEQNVEGILVIKKDGVILGFCRKDLENHGLKYYRAEEMNFGDTQELFRKLI